MQNLQRIYRDSLALLTDFYELTMAYGLWKSGMAEWEAVFHLSFRENPFGGGFTLAAGLEPAIEFITGYAADPSDLEYLATIRDRTGAPFFEPAFLQFLADLRFTIDLDAMPEGTPVFPEEPVLRVRGPLLQCQILESALLNQINFQSLVATKAARITSAAGADPVLEFGLRRAQGIDGALAASRAAYIGGCAATSNVLAGKIYGIPVAGTHSHSWVMAFDTEPDAFLAYAKVLPRNALFLVDTYQTLNGVRNAVEAGRWLRQNGSELLGVRINSGDLAFLSQEARRILDSAGFPQAQIVASNELDEYVVKSLKRQGARIDTWGIGTRLATAYDQPAIGGVYKLAALRRPGRDWEYKIKLSDQTAKTSIPGILQVRRYAVGGENVADVIYDIGQPPAGRIVIVDPHDAARRKTVPEGAESRDLLEPALRGGVPCASPRPLAEIRAAAQANLAGFHPGIRRFLHPHGYPAGLETTLHRRRVRLMADIADRVREEANHGSIPDR